MNVYRVGSFYPYGIVVAEDEDQVKKIASADRSLKGSEGIGQPTFGSDEWEIVLLDTSKPGVIAVNAG